MNRENLSLLLALPFLLGGGSFLIGAGRFLARGDGVGAAIYGFVGVFVILLAFVNYSRRMASSN
jgi:hypothetical protein